MRRSDSSWSVVVATMCAAVLFAVGSVQAVPVGLYTFEGNANDVSGNGNNATTVTAAFSGSGFQGMSADFTPNQFIQLPLNINPGVAPKVTIGAWVDADVVGTRGTILSSDNGGFDRGLNIDDRDGGGSKYAAFTGSGAVLGGNVASAADNFVFMAATFDQVAGMVTLNVDGATFSRAATQDVSQNFMRVGLHAFNVEPLDGRVDNVFVVNGALSNDQIEAIRLGGANAAQQAGAGAGQLIQVDLQVDAVNGLFNPAAPITNPGIGNGDVWNAAVIPSFTGVNPIPNPAVNPSFNNLQDSLGNTTGVSFSVLGNVSGFNNGDANNPVNTDYFFWGIAGTSSSIDWEISGLIPGAEYEYTALGAVDGNRTFNMLVDTDGDGDLSDETPSVVLAGLARGATFPSVFADGGGTILGRNAASLSGGEANWGGFQLRLLAAPVVPEPATVLLLAAGVAGLVSRRRRRTA